MDPQVGEVYYSVQQKMRFAVLSAPTGLIPPIHDTTVLKVLWADGCIRSELPGALTPVSKVEDLHRPGAMVEAIDDARRVLEGAKRSDKPLLEALQRLSEELEAIERSDRTHS